MKHNKIAFTAFFGQSFRLVSGPIVLLVISNKLSSSEIAIYYSFFSILAIQQVLEMGVGFTLRQFIAHAYRKDINGWTFESKGIVKGFFYFSSKWYLLISLFILFGVGPLGFGFLSTIPSDVNWQMPWLCLVFITSVFINLMPFQFVIEGCQDQIALYRAQLISSIVSSIVLVVSILMGCGLYAIVLSVLLSSATIYVLLFFSVHEKYKALIGVRAIGDFNTVLAQVWPMLSKISVTWILGYFFWNSFNLIAIKLLPINVAGQFALTLSLALAGFNIASVIVNSQTTVFSAHISSGNTGKALSIFKKSNLTAFLLLAAGYGIFLLAKLKFPDFYMLSKTLSFEHVSYIFMYFLLLLPVTNKANFARCFKKEPYFYFSLICNITVPVIFLVVCILTNKPDFKYLLFSSVFFVFWSSYIFKDLLKAEVLR